MGNESTKSESLNLNVIFPPLTRLDSGLQRSGYYSCFCLTFFAHHCNKATHSDNHFPLSVCLCELECDKQQTLQMVQPAVLSELSTEERNAVATFRAVTAIGSDDDARRILQSYSWNLEDAVSAYLDSPGSALSRAATMSNSVSHIDRSEQDVHSSSNTMLPRMNGFPPPRLPQQGQPIQSVVPSRQNGLNRMPRWLLTLLSPFRFVWSVLSNLTSQVIRALSGPAHLIESAPGSTPATRFRSFYESHHGTTHPTFFDGSYLSALSAANEQLRFLLVYIHSESHRLTPSFCRTIMANEAFISAVDSSFIMWAGSITQRDAAAAYNALRAPSLPLLAIVVARSRPAASDIERGQFGTLVALRAGPSTVTGGADVITSWLNRVSQRHAPILEELRSQREERESARLLRQQQDEEFAASLEADRRREQEAEEARAKEQREKIRLQELELRRARKKAALGMEPEKAVGITSLVVRLPDGSRIGRRFHKDETLEKVFDWAEVNGVDIEVACLVMSFPKKRFLYPEDAGRKIGDVGMFPSCMLLLESRDE